VGSLRGISKAVGNFSVPLQWMVGLRRLKQDAIWFEHVPSEGKPQTISARSTTSGQ